ncbi:MAG: MBL fold metallo-hydrolase [Kiritimatiellae bacterium]|nr:MBL fold metallo-hydrolase [Kiritimatiellia bacterium]
MLFKFLGTGTSVGVPQIGCACPVCTSADPRDRRRRCGAYVQGAQASFLIDTPPEMREAAIAYGIRKVDAICLTHAHMDHVAGFDDVRRFNTLNGGAPMRCFADTETIAKMHAIFPYIGSQPNAMGLFRPMINFVENSEPFAIGDVRVERLAVEHSFPCSGYLFNGKLAYISDCHALPEATVERLRGVEVLILNCLRERFHPTHLNFEAACGYFRRIAPRKGYTIHMCHDFSHAELLDKWRDTGLDVEPAYDGLEIEI